MLITVVTGFFCFFSPQGLNQVLIVLVLDQKWEEVLCDSSKFWSKFVEERNDLLIEHDYVRLAQSGLKVNSRVFHEIGSFHWDTEVHFETQNLHLINFMLEKSNLQH